MAHGFNTSYMSDSTALFLYYKKLGERAMEQCRDEDLFVAQDAESNSIAIIAKHMAGNMKSRWTDFLTSDGEKPDRNRDREFEDAPKTREALLEPAQGGSKYLHMQPYRRENRTGSRVNSKPEAERANRNVIRILEPGTPEPRIFTQGRIP